MPSRYLFFMIFSGFVPFRVDWSRSWSFFTKKSHDFTNRNVRCMFSSFRHAFRRRSQGGTAARLSSPVSQSILQFLVHTEINAKRIPDAVIKLDSRNYWTSVTWCEERAGEESWVRKRLGRVNEFVVPSSVQRAVCPATLEQPLSTRYTAWKLFRQF